MSVTPNMNLTLPTPTVTPGPTYATQNNTAFDAVDSHDHTTGKGVQVPSAGIGINDDLTMNGYNLTTVRTVRYDSQSAGLGDATDIGCVYVAGGNLFFNDISGTQIQLTAGGALNAASIGGIGGDYSTSTASVYYQAIDSTFYFTSNTNTPATVNAGSVIVREPVASSNSITLQSPVSLGSSYNLTLPTALPASTRIVSVTNTGTLAAGTAGVIQTDDIAALAVTGPKIANATIDATKMDATALASGTYIPSAASASNITIVAVPSFQYARVSGCVTVSGTLTANITTGVPFSFVLTLPVSSNNFAGVNQGAGMAVAVTSGLVGAIRATASAQTVTVSGVAGTAGANETICINFMYQVV